MTVCKHIVIGPQEEGLAAGEFSASFLSPKYVFFLWREGLSGDKHVLFMTDLMDCRTC